MEERDREEQEPEAAEVQTPPLIGRSFRTIHVAAMVIAVPLILAALFWRCG